MSGRDYPRLSIQDFGAHLLRTGDLDPVYIALHNLQGEWTQAEIHQWLVAYWCFYDCGFASYMCSLEPSDYWETLWIAAVNERPSPVGRWPRGRERRHFRGKTATDTVRDLRQRYLRPAAMVEGLFAQAPCYKTVAKAVQSHTGFGPWISFKVCDMLERICAVPINFDEAAVFMFKDPVKAAVMYWNQSHGMDLDAEATPTMIKQTVIPEVVAELSRYYVGVTAPPRHERDVNLQEVETILCKWKSHMNGHYPLNNDIHEIRHGVLKWAPHSEEAADFLAAMPEAGP